MDFISCVGSDGSAVMALGVLRVLQQQHTEAAQWGGKMLHLKFFCCWRNFWISLVIKETVWVSESARALVYPSGLSSELKHKFARNNNSTLTRLRAAHCSIGAGILIHGSDKNPLVYDHTTSVDAESVLVISTRLPFDCFISPNVVRLLPGTLQHRLPNGRCCTYCYPNKSYGFMFAGVFCLRWARPQSGCKNCRGSVFFFQ